MLKNFNPKESVLVCERCGISFCRSIKQIKQNQRRGRLNCCSLSCNTKKYVVRIVNTECKQCGARFDKEASQINKTTNHFCTRSCAAIWKNANKTSGFRRSKLEVFLEDKVRNELPNLQLIVNNRSSIGLELDMFFPDISLAVEINGIFHYQPIYGINKFYRTQEIDVRKRQKCETQHIKLVIVKNVFSTFTSDIGEQCWEFLKQEISLITNAT